MRRTPSIYANTPPTAPSITSDYSKWNGAPVPKKYRVSDPAFWGISAHPTVVTAYGRREVPG